MKHLGNSHALRNGVNAETQAKKMGHTTPRMARETYREIADPELHAAAVIFDGMPQIVEKKGALLSG